MRIAIVDVAVEEGGGGYSVLRDFLNYIQNDDYCMEQNWYIYTSIAIPGLCENVNNIIVPDVKKSWIDRLRWERNIARKEFESNNIDLVISFQNTGCAVGNYKQIAYFHNVVLLENKRHFSILKSEERRFAIYKLLVSKYTFSSLKNVNIIIAQTNTVRKQLLERVKNNNIKVINPNVEIDAKYKETATMPIKGFLYPTNPHPYKRIEDIIELVDGSHDWFEANHLEVLITINGDENRYAEQIKSRVKGLGHIIKLIGHQDRSRIMELYRDHALIYSSEMESYPIPFVESTYVGTPIVAALYPYSEECLDKLSNAFIYTPNNDLSFKNAIKKAYEYDGQRVSVPYKTSNTWSQLVDTIKSC